MALIDALRKHPSENAAEKDTPTPEPEEEVKAEQPSPPLCNQTNEGSPHPLIQKELPKTEKLMSLTLGPAADLGAVFLDLLMNPTTPQPYLKQLLMEYECPCTKRG